MKIIDYKRVFRNFTGVLGQSAECYGDVVRPELSYALAAMGNKND
jgi:hypothetical protein